MRSIHYHHGGWGNTGGRAGRTLSKLQVAVGAVVGHPSPTIDYFDLSIEPCPNIVMWAPRKHWDIKNYVIAKSA